MHFIHDKLSIEGQYTNTRDEEGEGNPNNVTLQQGVWRMWEKADVVLTWILIWSISFFSHANALLLTRLCTVSDEMLQHFGKVQPWLLLLAPLCKRCVLKPQGPGGLPLRDFTAGPRISQVCQLHSQWLLSTSRLWSNRFKTFLQEAKTELKWRL